MDFFARRGEYPPAGLFSAGHVFMLVTCLIILISLILIFLKRPSSNPYRLVRVIGVLVFVLEIVKTVWGLSAGRYSDWYEYLPIWFCSLFIPFCLLAGFTKGKLQKLALSFLYYGGLIGGSTYLVFPTTSIGRYPFWHFITFHSMFYHTIMIFVALYIVKNHLIKPGLKDMWGYVWTIIAACVLAYVVNENLGTNYMFLAKPASNNVLLQFALAVAGPLYPVAVTLFQAFVSFFLALGLYQLYLRYKNVKSNKV